MRVSKTLPRPERLVVANDALDNDPRTAYEITYKVKQTCSSRARRCLFPECPAPQNCARCDEAGVLGPVPGAIGTLQATEAIKVLTRVGRPLSGRLLLYDALEATFRTVRLRGPRPGCAACCSSDAELRRCGGLREYDYHTFTGGQAMEEKQAGVALLRPEQRVSCGELRALLDSERSNGAADGGGGSGGKVVLVDVRPPELFAAGRLPGAVHVPMAQVRTRCETAHAGVLSARC